VNRDSEKEKNVSRNEHDSSMVSRPDYVRIEYWLKMVKVMTKTHPPVLLVGFKVLSSCDHFSSLSQFSL
jgi:hypothetical protein